MPCDTQLDFASVAIPVLSTECTSLWGTLVRLKFTTSAQTIDRGPCKVIIFGEDCTTANKSIVSMSFTSLVNAVDMLVTDTVSIDLPELQTEGCIYATEWILF